MPFAGLHATGYWIATRVVATLWPISLLGVARLFFHRFDPARVRAVPNEKARRSWIGRLNLISKPIARLFVRVLLRSPEMRRSPTPWRPSPRSRS